MKGLTPTLTTPERCEYLHDSGLRLIFTDMNPTSRGSGLEAFITARWQGNIPEPRLLTFGTYNLKGARTVTTLTNEILAADKDLDKATVRTMASDCVQHVISVFFDRHQAIPLSEVPRTTQRWLLKPFLEAHSVTRLIAAGGSLKSLLALSIAVTVSTGSNKLLGLKPAATGPILYLDWEADPESHAERLRALCKPTGLQIPDDIYYMRMSSSLYLAQRRIAAAVAELEPALIIVDSNAMARGASGEGGAEDSTIRMITALRSFRTASLIVDHKSDEKARRGLAGGYGSVFNRNLARLEWEVNRLVTIDNTTSIVLRLEKANNLRTRQEVAYQFTIHTTSDDIWDQVIIAGIEPNSIIPLPTDAGGSNANADKISHFLRRQTEAQAVKDIASRCGLTLDVARTTLNRLARAGMVENISESSTGLWRLTDQDTDEGYRDALPAPF